MKILPLIRFFEPLLPLEKHEIAELEQRLIFRKIKRKQFLLAEGEICKHYYFVIQGCFKMFKADPSGKEHNLLFAIENQWISDIGSFHTENPSQLFIEALEEGEVIQLAKADLIHFYTVFPKFNRVFRVMIEDQFVELQNRLLQTFSSTAEERYEAFLNDHPELIQRLPNTQIASYIGITPEFLSRIRHQIASK